MDNFDWYRDEDRSYISDPWGDDYAMVEYDWIYGVFKLYIEGAYEGDFVSEKQARTVAEHSFIQYILETFPF